MESNFRQTYSRVLNLPHKNPRCRRQLDSQNCPALWGGTSACAHLLIFAQYSNRPIDRLVSQSTRPVIANVNNRHCEHHNRRLFNPWPVGQGAAYGPAAAPVLRGCLGELRGNEGMWELQCRGKRLHFRILPRPKLALLRHFRFERSPVCPTRPQNRVWTVVSAPPLPRHV